MRYLKFYELQLILQDGHPTEGSELTREVYRWDQRLFSVVLRLPGIGGSSTNSKEPLPSELALTKLSEATGGKSQSYSIYYVDTLVMVIFESLCNNIGLMFYLEIILRIS